MQKKGKSAHVSVVAAYVHPLGAVCTPGSLSVARGVVAVALWTTVQFHDNCHLNTLLI
jgi:hypothetical protein